MKISQRYRLFRQCSLVGRHRSLISNWEHSRSDRETESGGEVIDRQTIPQRIRQGGSVRNQSRSYTKRRMRRGIYTGEQAKRQSEESLQVVHEEKHMEINECWNAEHKEHNNLARTMRKHGGTGRRGRQLDTGDAHYGEAGNHTGGEESNET